MALQDYSRPSDYFEPDSAPGGLDFPCSACKHQGRAASDEPCQRCGHNANAVLRYSPEAMRDAARRYDGVEIVGGSDPAATK